MTVNTVPKVNTAESEGLPFAIRVIQVSPKKIKKKHPTARKGNGLWSDWYKNE